MEQRTSLLEIIEYINPAELDYQSWVNVGMALKHEGYSVSDWDAWSRQDYGRYHAGECEKKWNTFRGTSSPVTGGTIVQMAMERGWEPQRGHELDWDDLIRNDTARVVDSSWVEEKEVQEPEDWDPVKELITYIETLFGTDERVGYVTRSWSKPDDDKKYPDKGSWDRTARQLIQKLSKCKGDVGAVLGDYDPEAGAWIRFNPLDGKGCKNENVTEYRYALVESDNTSIEKQNTAIIIDPIYKVITGDENSADQMANFCNQFDLVCTELGCAVIYCHHHSKGSQGSKKSMDRASGSGVFARDPDALLDLIELETTEPLIKQEENKAVCRECKQYLDAHFQWQNDLSQDDLCSQAQMINYCKEHLDKRKMQELQEQIDKALQKVKNLTAWRIEGTLREFPKFEPVNLWFDYPAHRLDEVGSLKDVQVESEQPAWRQKKKTPEERKAEKEESFRIAFEANDVEGTGRVKLSDLKDYMGVTLNTVKKYVDEMKGFKREDGVAVRVSKT